MNHARPLMGAHIALDSAPPSPRRRWAISLAGGTLLRRFTLASLLATVGIGSIFGWAGSRLAVDYALRSRTQAIAVQVAEFMAPRLVPEDFTGRKQARRVQFEFATRDLLGKAGILHVRVWNSNGDLLYSRGEPPATPRTPPEVERALIGEISSRYLDEGGGTPYRLEVSIPIRLAKAGRLVGAYQVVADITDLNEAIRSLTLTVWKSIILGILVLYLALFTIVRRASEDLVRQQEQLRQGFIGTIESLVRAVDARDVATADHSSRVAHYAEAMARALHLRNEVVQHVKAAAFLHDVGKIGIRDDILATENTLTPEQWELVRRHTVTGYEILQPVPIPEAIRLGVLHSHEAWDGGGYPDGLAGEAIPLAARIIAVADTYEVLTKGRPYKAARSSTAALAEIARRSGTQFDPQVVEALHRVSEVSADEPASTAAIRPQPSADVGA